MSRRAVKDAQREGGRDREASDRSMRHSWIERKMKNLEAERDFYKTKLVDIEELLTVRVCAWAEE